MEPNIKWMTALSICLLFSLSCGIEDRRKALALTGDPDAQIDLGVLYYFGSDLPFQKLEPDFAEAFKWFEKAANQGSAKGECAVGLLYFNGEGVEKNHKMAYLNFLMAAEKGEPFAAHALGYYFVFHNDCSRAFPWYKTAAELGDKNAELVLGYFTEHQRCHEPSFREKLYDAYFDSMRRFLVYLDAEKPEN